MFQLRIRRFWGVDIALAATGIAFVAIIGSSAAASPLLPGTAVAPTPLAIIPAGDTIIPGATETNPFVGLGAAVPPSMTQPVVFTGELTSTVYTDPTTGGLDFLYQLSNDPTSPDSLEELSLSSFAPNTFTTDADYVVGTGNVNPDLATRSTGSGKTIDFFFPGVGQGQDTSYLLVETNATTYMVGTGAVIDGGTGDTLVNAPGVTILMSNVPEPASFSAILLAGGMLFGRRRR
jgi:hypothetical protein